MSALFGDESESATETLRRAGQRRLLFDPRPLGGEPETGFDPLTEEQRRKGRELLQLEFERERERTLLRRKGIDVDDVERERALGRRPDDNKTESQKEREENIAKRLRELERRMNEDLHIPHLWGPRSWIRPRRGPRDI